MGYCKDRTGCSYTLPPVIHEYFWVKLNLIPLPSPAPTPFSYMMWKSGSSDWCHCSFNFTPSEIGQQWEGTGDEWLLVVEARLERYAPHTPFLLRTLHHNYMKRLQQEAQLHLLGSNEASWGLRAEVWLKVQEKWWKFVNACLNVRSGNTYQRLVSHAYKQAPAAHRYLPVYTAVATNCVEKNLWKNCPFW